MSGYAGRIRLFVDGRETKMNDASSLIRRVELLEGATSTLIKQQDEMRTEMQSQFRQVHTELTHLKNTQNIMLDMLRDILSRLPQKEDN